MSYLWSDHASREKELGATPEEFCAWMEEEHQTPGVIPGTPAFEMYKTQHWEFYLEALENAAETLRSDARDYQAAVGF